MSNFITENLLNQLNAFHLVMVIFGYLLLVPFIPVVIAVLTGEVILTLYHVLIIASICAVMVVFLFVALGVYNKANDVKIATANKVEIPATEAYSIKRGITDLLALLGLKVSIEKCPDTEKEEIKIDLGDISEEELKNELIRRIGEETDG